eukprot:1160137-Pelagomonas_calceolata.AAC.20
MKGSYAVRHLLFHMSTPTAARVHLLISGCTLLAARRMLFALGAARVSAFVTHAAFGHSSELACALKICMLRPGMPCC